MSGLPIATTFVLMAGLPGTGKTTLAEALSRRLGGVVLSKDKVRASLFPSDLIDYSVAQDDLCMDAVIEAAQYLAAHSRVPFVFLDGRTFSHAYQIEQVIPAAESAGAKWKILYLSCPDEIAQQRLEHGREENHIAKNRDFRLYLDLKSRFEPITWQKLDVDTSRSLDECIRMCREELLP